MTEANQEVQEVQEGKGIVSKAISLVKYPIYNPSFTIASAGTVGFGVSLLEEMANSGSTGDIAFCAAGLAGTIYCAIASMIQYNNNFYAD